MKPRFPFLLFTIFLFSAFATRTQNNFKPGCVVTLQGDTVRGYLDHQEWPRNPLTFSFKRTLEAKVVDPYSPTDARYVALEGLEAWTNFPVRAGLEVNKRWDLSFLYWTLALLIDGSGTVSSLHSSQVGVSYFFNK